jgi:hypothetical protein
MTTVIDTAHCICEVFRWVRDSGLLDAIFHTTPKAIPQSFDAAPGHLLLASNW